MLHHITHEMFAPVDPVDPVVDPATWQICCMHLFLERGPKMRKSLTQRGIDCVKHQPLKNQNVPKILKGKCGKSALNSTNTLVTGWWFKYSEFLNWQCSQAEYWNINMKRTAWRLGRSIGFICAKCG